LKAGVCGLAVFIDQAVGGFDFEPLRAVARKAATATRGIRGHLRVAFDFRVVSGAIRAISTRAPDQPLPVQAKAVISVQGDARLLAIDREYLAAATNFRNTRHVPANTGESVTCPAVIGERDGWLQAVYAFGNSYGNGVRRRPGRSDVTVTGR